MFDSDNIDVPELTVVKAQDYLNEESRLRKLKNRWPEEQWYALTPEWDMHMFDNTTGAFAKQNVTLFQVKKGKRTPQRQCFKVAYQQSQFFLYPILANNQSANGRH